MRAVSASGGGGAQAFNEFLCALFAAQEDDFEVSKSDDFHQLRQQSWKLMDGVADYHPACAKVLEGLAEGLAAGCGRRIAVDMKPSSGGAPPFTWSIG